MFYEAKVTEDSALVVDAWKAQSKRQGRTLSAADLADCKMWSATSPTTTPLTCP